MLTIDDPSRSLRSRPRRAEPGARSVAAPSDLAGITVLEPSSGEGSAETPRPIGATEVGVRAQRRGSLYLLLVVVALLCVVGLVMVLSASSVLSLRAYGTPWHYFERQILWLTLGLVGFLVALRVDLARWRRLAVISMVFTLGLLVAVLVPGVGLRTAGAARWRRRHPMS